MSDMKRRSRKRSKRVPKVGDRVLIRYGDHDVPAVVLEDRGFIGNPPNRHRYLFIEVHLAHVTPPKELEVRADRVRLASRTKRRSVPGPQLRAAES